MKPDIEEKTPLVVSGSQTWVLAGSVTISADVLDHCTIAPTLVVHVIVTGAVFAHLGCG